MILLLGLVEPRFKEMWCLDFLFIDIVELRVFFSSSLFGFGFILFIYLFWGGGGCWGVWARWLMIVVFP